MMNRKQFIRNSGMVLVSFLLKKKAFAMQQVKPKEFYFKDDGRIPNSGYPLLLYQQAFDLEGSQGGDWLEEQFAANDWTNTWRWGVYPFHHYHSNTHEVLGVFSGDAMLHLGGETGEKIKVRVGDIIIIPAGVGHKCLSHSEDFTVLGAYPGGLSPDLNRGETGERPQTDKNIARVPFPSTDPLTGKTGGLKDTWKE